MSVLRVENVGKAFRSYKSEWQRLSRWFGLTKESASEHWVLRHVSFEVNQGEAIGIVGQNGSGKSTLLKMIAGTTAPSEGAVSLTGRVAAILELGLGFNAELTGRENVMRAGSLMGFSPDELHQAMPDIEAFAEIGEYFDQPVRSCSTGMQMRVAFAIATAYRPDILIIDEVMAVGDAYFQHKCIARIQDYREQGTTLLLVSHDRGAVLGLCGRAILLENGYLVKDGDAAEVMDFYNAIIAEKEERTVKQDTLKNGQVTTVSGTGEAQVLDVALLNAQGEEVSSVVVGEQVQLRVKVKVFSALDELVLGYAVKDRLGQIIFGTNTHYLNKDIEHPQAGEEHQFDIRFLANFGIGSYSVSLALHSGQDHLNRNYEWRDVALIFNVVSIGPPTFVGCCWMEPEISVDGR